VPKNGLATISAPRASSPEVVRKWLVVFTEICQRDLTPALVAIWVEQLGDIPPDRLQQAFDRLAKTWRSNFLPTPGNVRAQLDDADSHGLTLCAEDDWQNYLAWSREYFHPDTGIAPRAPHLSAQTEHAIRAAGGHRYIATCSEDNLQWAKRRFVADFELIHETEAAEHLLSDGNAKRIIHELAAGAPHGQKRISRSTGSSAPEQMSEKPSRKEVREVLDRVTAEKPRPPVSDPPADLEKAWRAQKERLAARCAELGIPFPVALPKNVAESEAATR
jgi:hypothetical protein